MNVDNATSTQDIAFPSVAALRSAHTQLLKQQQIQPDYPPEFLKAIELFIYKGQASGALIDNDDDRWACQSLLDYWNTILYRSGITISDATLAEFDSVLLPTLAESLCPYLGLEAFRENSHDRFFGRQHLVETLIDRLKDHRFLVVVGSSGSGKSSVVMGGLLPQLKAGALPNSQDWHYYPPIVPGSNPLLTLARRLRPTEETSTEWLQEQVQHFRQDDCHLLHLINQSRFGTVVLYIDQFEEVFPLDGDIEIQQAFVNNLLQLVHAPEADHRVILTMRIDFKDRVVKIPNFQVFFEQSCIQVLALDASELREVIEKPADIVGLKFEDGLVDALVKDALGEPAALPLLQFTLLKLWESRDHNRLTWDAYQKLGGGRKALTNSADEFYNSLIPQQQLTAKRILLSMVQIKEGVEFTSQRIPRQNLYRSGEARDQVDAVLDKLIYEEHLVRLTEGDTSGEAQVEVAHEAIIRNWERFVDWLNKERVRLGERIHLRALAEQWQTKGRDPSLLLRGNPLREAQEYEDLEDLTREFVQFSVEVEQAKVEAERKQWEEKLESRRNKVILSVIAIVILSISTVWVSIVNLELKNKQDVLVEKQDELEKLNSAYQNISDQLQEKDKQFFREKLKEATLRAKREKKNIDLPSASKEVEKGLKALVNGKLTESRKHFDIAYQKFPYYPNIEEILILIKQSEGNYNSSVNPDQKGVILRSVYTEISNNYYLGLPPNVLEQIRNRNRVKIEYFPKKGDSQTIIINKVLDEQLNPLGFLIKKMSPSSAKPINNISYGKKVDIDTVKLVAKELVGKQVNITVIDQFLLDSFPADGKKEFEYKIQIGTDTERKCTKAWTILEIEEATEFNGCLPEKTTDIKPEK